MTTRRPAPAVWGHATLWRAVLRLALLALAGCRLGDADWAAVEAGIRARYPDVEPVSTAQLAAWRARPDTVQPILLDVRAADEHAVSHLAGARLATDIDAALEILASAPADTPVVAYCSVGYRSAGLAEALQQRGYRQVRNLEGSLFSWANEGRALWRGDQRVAVVHPYGRPWTGLLAPEHRATAKQIAAARAAARAAADDR